MTQPPDSNPPEGQPDPANPGWGSAPVDPPAAPPPPPPGGQTPPAGPSDPFGPPPSYPGAGAGTPPPPPPGYPPTGGAPPGYGPPAPQTNQKAIWSLVTGVLSFCCCLTGIAAIILGVQARNEVKASNGWQKGDGMALAGLILGIVGIAGSVLYGVFLVATGDFSTAP